MRRAALLLMTTVAACAPLPAPSLAPAVKPAETRAAAPTGSDLLGFVPAPAEAVLLVEVARLRSSPWAKPMLAWAAERERDGEAGRLGRGFDEVADVDRWLFARVGSAASGRGTLELAQGRFEARRVLDAFAARRPEARPQRFAGLAGAADGEQAVALLDGDPITRTLVFGPPFAVQAAAAVARSASGSARDAPWLASIQAALEDEAVGNPKSLAVELAFVVQPEARPELAQMLGSDVPLSHLGGRLFLDRQARAVLLGLAPGRGEAQAIAADVGEQVRALADRRSVRALSLAPMLERASVTARGARVVMELGVSEDERTQVSEKLAALAAVLAKSPDNPPP